MEEKKNNGKTLRTSATPFTTIPLELLMAEEAIIIESGEVVPITDTILRAYVYMRNMYCLSLDSPKSYGYFESWESIAASIGRNVDAFKKGKNRVDKALEKLGLLKITKGGRGRSLHKTVYDITVLEGKVTLTNNKRKAFKLKNSYVEKPKETVETQKPVPEEASYDYDYENMSLQDSLDDFPDMDEIPF